jgi:hypothetical protein
MSRRATLVLLALGLLLPAASRAEDAPQQKGILARAIRLVEEPEEKRGPFPMPFGTTPQDVDINSTVRIRVSREELLAGLSGNPALTSAARDVVALRTSARELLKAEDFLQNAIGDATTLTQLELEHKRDTPEFQAAAERDQERVNTMLTIVLTHLDALKASSSPELQQHAADALKRSDAAILSGPENKRQAYAAFLVEEIQWTLQQLEAARGRLETDSPGLSLVLSASLVRQTGTSEAPLPHYNNLPVGLPKSIDKINLALPPEQAALQADAAALAQVLNRAVQDSSALRNAVRQLLTVQGIDVQELEAALDAVKKDADQIRSTDWSQVGNDLESQLRALLNEATAEQRKLLEETLLPEVEDLQTRAQDLRSTLVQLLTTVSGLRSQLSSGASQDPAAQVVALLSLAQVAAQLASREFFQNLRSEVDVWTQAATSLRSQVGEVRTAAQALPDKLKQPVKDLLTQTAEARLGTLVKDLGALRTSAGNVGGQLQAFAARLKGAPALAIALSQKPPSTSFQVAFKEIKDTWLDIRTLHPRSDDDVVVVRAWLYRLKPDPNDPTKLVEDGELDSDLQQLRLLRFGWYSTPGVGVVYMSSTNDLLQQDGEMRQTRAFAPQVSWLLRHRAWQTPQIGDDLKPFRSYHSPWKSVSAGLHTLSLDLDNDNQQELGLGLSVSFFNGFLQIGGGWDVGLDDEPYVFIGTRLLELARGLGTSNQPATPAQ